MRSCLIAFLIAVLNAGCWQSVSDQAHKLGDREFTRERWANATEVQRGEMTASLLEQPAVAQSDRQGIVALLGRPTGYYDYDTNPAYVVGPPTVQSIYADGYLLVFETDKRNGKVERVFFVPEVD